MPLETLLALNYFNSVILTVAIIGVDSHARDMYGNSHSQGTWLLEVPSMHKLVQYFQSLCSCRNKDVYELKGVRVLPTLKLIFVQAVLNTVVYQMLIVYTNVLVNSAVL